MRWRVEGRDRSRSFKSKGEAERLASRLRLSAESGEQFDLESGFPESWLEAPDAATWWTWSRDYVERKWSQWSGHSRRSAAESLVTITPLMTRRGAPAAPPDLVPFLRHTGYGPGSDAAPAPAWLRRWSVPLHDIDAHLLEHVLSHAATRQDGERFCTEVIRRRRTMVNAVLRSAVRHGLLDVNPMDRVEWRAPTRSLAVDVSTVPAPDDIDAIVDHVAASGGGARYAALFAIVGWAGMRPSEAIGLCVVDVTMPVEGWGLAILRGAITSPGVRYSRGGGVVEAKGLKQRPVNATREVPLAPRLVTRLRGHLELWPPVDGRVFSNAAGRPPTTTNYGPVWGRARRTLWSAPHPLAAVTVYDLRHAAATMMLRAGVPPAEVARRLGHSVDMLLRVYAGVFSDERDRSNALIDDALADGSAQ